MDHVAIDVVSDSSCHVISGVIIMGAKGRQSWIKSVSDNVASIDGQSAVPFFRSMPTADTEALGWIVRA